MVDLNQGLEECQPETAVHEGRLLTEGIQFGQPGTWGRSRYLGGCNRLDTLQIPVCRIVVAIDREAGSGFLGICLKTCRRWGGLICLKDTREWRMGAELKCLRNSGAIKLSVEPANGIRAQ